MQRIVRGVMSLDKDSESNAGRELSRKLQWVYSQTKSIHTRRAAFAGTSYSPKRLDRRSSEREGGGAYNAACSRTASRVFNGVPMALRPTKIR